MLSKIKKLPLFGTLTLILALVVFSTFSIFIGVHKINGFDVIKLTEIQRVVIFSTRIPRTISLILAGSTLAISGLLMQHLTQNKFVSPSTSGTMASARLGVIVSILFFGHLTVMYKTFIAFIFALMGTLFFTRFLRTVKLKNSMMVPLVGLMFGNIITSFSSYLAIQHEIVQNASSWLQGNFALISSNNYQLILLTVPILLTIYIFAHYFTIMGLGKNISTELGISYAFFETIGIILVSLGTASVILSVGSIPFVGIIIPNIISLKRGDHFGNILLPTALLGALFLVLSDILSRLIIFPYEMPIGIVISVVGSVMFLYLLLRGERK